MQGVFAALRYLASALSLYYAGDATSSALLSLSRRSGTGFCRWRVLSFICSVIHYFHQYLQERGE
jgi:hypothetical protein